MIIREYTDEDFDEIRELHAQSGFNYSLPNLSREEFFSRRVIGGGDSDSIGMAAFLRLSAEVYLICDPKWRTPAWRNEAIRQLHIASIGDAREAKVRQLVAFLPPQVTKSFGRRLKKHRWTSYQDMEWKCFSREVE